ncbi:BTB/POZ and MATH domain-containing protein 2-like [Miscanthus floridulus]|uniref:BTB/POZ and MATH domain-containing protein 2-like n=1 Tax=Miscanthus floridulus TaxID=154761 RepID=UPI00345B35D3
MSVSKTVSTSAAETELGTHVFHVVGYSQQRAIGAHKDKSIVSGHFSVGGHDWIMLLMADIYSKPDCIPISLMLMKPVAAGVLASFELRLVNQSTGLPFTVHKEAPMVFGDNNNMAATGWIKRSLLESPTYLQNDCLAVECIVTVIKERLVSKTKSLPRIKVPPSNMAEHFGSLLETDLGADVTFSVGAETFKAHKIVLATRSPVFKAELYGPMKEEGMGPITIKDVQPDVFRALLHFIYTDSLPPLDDLEADDHSEMIRHLLVAADRYAIERLKLICQSFLCENLNVQTVATTLALADQHNCDVLKEACIEFITCSNVMDDLLSTQGYKNLKRTCPAVVMDALEKTSKFRKA